MIWYSDYSLNLVFDIRCGQGAHDVALTLTAWGTVETATPCDLLPATIRRFAGSDCTQRLSLLKTTLQHRFQRLYCEERSVPFVEPPESILNALCESDTYLQEEPQDPLDELPESISAQVKTIISQWDEWQERLPESAEQLRRELWNGQQADGEQLQAGLKSDDPLLRWASAVTAGARRETSLTESLIALTTDLDFGVQVAAVWALTEMCDARSVAVLSGRLRDERLIPPLRGAMALALGHIGDPCAVEALVEALRDDHWEVREPAVWALGNIGDPRAVKPLVHALNDWTIRNEARDALVHIGAAAVEPLIKTLRRSDAETRREIVRALGQIDDPRVVDALMAALADDHSQVRQEAARVLGEIRDARALEPLRQAMNDANRQVRNDAAWAFDQIQTRVNRKKR